MAAADRDTTRVGVVYYSSYRGATAQLAKAVAAGAGRVDGAEVVVLAVDEIDSGDAWATLHACDALIFGSPTYVGAVAAGFKRFIEACAGDVFIERLWTNKVAGAFTVSAGRNGGKMNCLTDIFVFATQMGMIWVPVPITGGNYSTEGSESDLNRMAGYIGVMAQANIDEPPELAPPPSDIRTAEIYGEHVATIARRLQVGTPAVPGGVEPGVPAGGVPSTLFDSMPDAEIGSRIPGDRGPSL